MKSKLNRQQISDLISIYQNSLQKLTFQVSRTQETIDELEKMLKSTKPEPEVSLTQPAGGSEVAKPKRRRRGRPKKSETKTASAPTGKKKRGRGRPKKSATASTVSKKTASTRGRKKKTTPKVAEIASSAPGYRLSEWDEFVMKQLQSGAKLKSDLVDAAEKQKSKLGPKMNKKQVYVKISNVLHKLSNNKKLINKVDTDGRGYAYELAAK